MHYKMSSTHFSQGQTKTLFPTGTHTFGVWHKNYREIKNRIILRTNNLISVFLDSSSIICLIINP